MTADRPGRPRWVSRTVHFPVTRIVLYLGGIAVALWILRLVPRGLAAGLGAWWSARVANAVLPILAVHFVYAASPEPWSGGRRRARPARRIPSSRSS